MIPDLWKPDHNAVTTLTLAQIKRDIDAIDDKCSHLIYSFFRGISLHNFFQLDIGIWHDPHSDSHIRQLHQPFTRNQPASSDLHGINTILSAKKLMKSRSPIYCFIQRNPFQEQIVAVGTHMIQSSQCWISYQS